MNSNKNKLNSKINWLFNLEPNAHLGPIWDSFIFLKLNFFFFFFWKYCKNSTMELMNSTKKYNETHE